MAVSAKDKLGLFLVTATTVTVAVYAKPWIVGPPREGAQRFADLGSVESGPLVFKDVNVLPMDRETVLYRHVVVVDDGVITEMGPLGGVEVPADASVLDGRGRQYLIPGLVDAHVHTGEGFQAWAPLLVAHGITTVFTPDAHAVESVVRAERGLPSPTVYVTAGLGHGGPDGPEAANETSAAAFTSICTHEVTPAMLDDLLPEDLGRLAQDWSRNGVWFSPRLVAMEAVSRQWGSPEGLAAALRRGSSREVPQAMLRRWADENPLVSLDPALKPRVDELRRFKHGFLQELRRVGAPVLAGTDTPFPLVAPGASLLDEIEALAGAGMSRFEALAAATSQPGRFVRAFVDPESNFGVVRPGARADLVLLEGDPLDRLSLISQPVGVMLGGRYMPRQLLSEGVGASRSGLAGDWP